MVLENWTGTCKIMKLELYLTPCTKVNSKCIKDLRPESVKLLEEKIAEDLLDIGLNDFLAMTPKGKTTKA